MEHTRENDIQVIELKNELVDHAHIEALRDAHMVQQIELLQEQVASLTESVKLLIDLWSQAKGVVNFVKWLVGVGSAVGAVILFIKDHVK